MKTIEELEALRAEIEKNHDNAYANYSCDTYDEDDAYDAYDEAND